MNLLSAARKYAALGISIIPTDEVKRSLIAWKPFQEKIMDEREIKQFFTNPKARGIAAICGQVSGNLEVIDIDIKYDLSGSLYDDYTSLIKEHNADLFKKLLIIRTKSGGYHLYYRCEVIEGNQKLAMRLCSENEKKENPNVRVQVLIETRGEAGYVIGPPTEGYKKHDGDKIPIISLDERDLLLDLARTFNQVLAEPVRVHSMQVDQKQYGLSPFEDFNLRGDAEMVLLEHDWTFCYERGGKRYYRRPGKTEGVSGSFWPERKWFGVFTTSSEFDTNKAYSPVGVFAMLEAGNDFSKAAKMLLDRNFGEKRVSYGKMENEVFKRKMDGMSRGELKSYLVKNYNIQTDEEADEKISNLERQWGETLLTFWEVDKNKKVSINRFKLERFLSEVGGFYLYFYDKSSNIFKVIQENNGLVTESSTEQIKKFVKEYILGLPECFDGGVTQQELLEVIYKGSETYFSKSFFEFIERKEIDFLKDTATEAFFPFKNGVVAVTKSDVKLKTYGELKKSIWATQIIDFDIDIIAEIEVEDAEFCEFIQKICSDDEDRISRAFSLIGYLLHKYKDPSTPFAVIFCEETEDESKGGGTGKGLLVKALTKLLNSVIVDGKNFKHDKSFVWQRVGLDTKLIVIEDTRKGVDFEGFYPAITEGITSEKKNKDEIFIPYTDSPKIVFTTNYSLSKKGNHAKRRQQDLEFSNFFHPGNTPINHFKHRLYDDWDKDEWNRFYNMLFWCVKFYLGSGVIEAKNSDTSKRKHIKLSYSEEFMEWFDEYSSNGYDNWTHFKDLYSDFLKRNDYDKKDFSKKRFKSALLESTEVMEWILEEQKNGQTRLPEFKLKKDRN